MDGCLQMTHLLPERLLQFRELERLYSMTEALISVY